MTASGDRDLVVLANVTNRLIPVLDAIESHQWSMATPCADWDLADLVDHVTGGNWFTVAVLAGEPAADALAGAFDRFAGASATAEQAIGSAGDQLAAFQRSGVLERTWSHVGGNLTGRQIMRLRLHDLIVHTWDIEQSLDRAGALPDDLVGWAMAELATADSVTARYFPPVTPVARSGGAAVAYLDRFGRKAPPVPPDVRPAS